MKHLALLIPFFALLPAVTHADGLETLITGAVGFLSEVVIPFLFAIAFLIFAVNVVRYFVFGSTSDEGREKAKNLAIYSVLAFVILIVFWGIVNTISSLLGFGGAAQPTSDYADPNSVRNAGVPQASPTNPADTTNAPVNLLPPLFDDPQAPPAVPPNTAPPTTPPPSNPPNTLPPINPPNTAPPGGPPQLVPIDNSLPGNNLGCDDGASFDQQGRPCGLY